MEENYLLVFKECKIEMTVEDLSNGTVRLLAESEKVSLFFACGMFPDIQFR